MSKHSNREGKPNAKVEVFRAFLTDSQDSPKQPTGRFKDIFEKFIAKSAKHETLKTLNGPKPSQGNSTERKTSDQVE